MLGKLMLAMERKRKGMANFMDRSSEVLEDVYCMEEFPTVSYPLQWEFAFEEKYGEFMRVLTLERLFLAMPEEEQRGFMGRFCRRVAP